MMNIPLAKSELMLFDRPSAQVSINSSKWVDIHPLNSVGENTAPIEFNVNASDDSYLDLNDTSLYVRFHVSPIDPSKPFAVNDVAPVNNILSSLFSDVELSLNNTVVEGGSFMYPYQSYLTNMLNYSRDVKKSNLKSSGFYIDEANKFDLKDNKGHCDRFLLISKGTSVELMGPLNVSFLQQAKYLLPKINMKLKLSRSKSDFILQNYGNKKANIKIDECILYIRQVKVNPIILKSHEDGLKINNAVYPYQKLNVSNFTISKGASTESREIFVNSPTPKLLIISLVSNSAFNGSLKKNPFNFKHFDLNFVGLYVNGESIPFPPIHMDVENDQYIRAYTSMIQNLEHFTRDESNGITPEEFIGGSTMFVFNLTPDLCYNGGQLYNNNNVRLDLKFKKPLDESINVILYSIIDGCVEVTSDRKIIQ